MIDWVMYTASDIYHATSFKLDNMGYSLQANVNPQALWGQSFPIERFYAGYTYIHQKRHDNTEIFKSNYALEYLRHKIVLQLDHRIISHLSASWSFRWQDRMGSYLRYENGKSTGEKVDYKPYGILDLKLLWSKHNYQFYAEANNLTNRRFYDLGNVRQPGVWFMVGGNWKIDF
jgi:iron complex outermembrane receptor protein